MSNTVGETEGVTQDVASDPTVGTPDFCIMCGHVILCDICDEEMVGSGDEYNEEEPAHDSLADVAESDKLPTKN